MNATTGKILVVGASGQVGSELVKQLRAAGAQVTAWTRADVDYSNAQAVGAKLAALEASAASGVPAVIFNAAAYTQVDQAESDPVTARAVNVELPRLLAEFAKKWNAVLVHYSTDYVYPGAGTREYLESDPTGPLSVYGQTKLAGDEAVLASGAHALIFRTSWVFAEAGKNFVQTMLRLGREREGLSVVADQVGAPTFAPDLGQYSIEALDVALALEKAAAGNTGAFPTGVYHLTNAGHASWHEFATAIFEEARALGVELKVNEVRAIATADYPTPARRPLNSRLSLEKVGRVLGVRPRAWQEALREALKRCLTTFGSNLR